MQRFCFLFLISWCLFGYCFLSLDVSRVEASPEFASSIKTAYVYNENGVPAITQNISFTNRLSDTYVTSYQFTVFGSKPENISGRDKLGPLKIAVENRDDSTTHITVNFNQQVVGKGNTLNFSLTYTGQPAVHKGQVWEITIPKTSTSELFDESTISLSVPNGFGKPADIDPVPDKSENNIYFFSGSQVGNSVIKAAFGDFQSFTFNLEYKLTNPSAKTISQKILLPPDTPYQHVFYSSINPHPPKIYSDQDGNWLAEYVLLPNQTQRIAVSGQFHIQPFPDDLRKFPTLEELKTYLYPSSDWVTNDPQVQSLAATYRTPKAIYDYVIASIPKNSPSLDYSNLFITLCRSAGIPARQLIGFANPGTHSWAEFWDTEKNIWTGVDPALGHFDQFDYNHFVYNIRGSSVQSSYIFPTKNIVEPSAYTDFNHPKAEFSWKKPSFFYPFFPQATFLEIKNPSGFAIYNIRLSITSQNLSVTSPATEIISILPPFSTYTFPIIFSGLYFPDFSAKYLNVQVGDQNLTYNIPSNLFFISHVIFAFIISAIIISLAFAATKAWSLYLQRSKRGNHLRRQS